MRDAHSLSDHLTQLVHILEQHVVVSHSPAAEIEAQKMSDSAHGRSDASAEGNID